MTATDRTAASTFRRVALDLAHQAFPELAAATRACSDRVLKQWRDLSLKAMPHLNALTLEEFEDTIAPILSAAADAFQSADPEQLRGLLEEAPSHGVDRFVQKHSLLDLFEEVRILRGVIIVAVAGEMKRPLEADEAATFHAIFDIIIQQGVIALVHKHDEQLGQFDRIMREMNEKLLTTAVRHDELLEQAGRAEEALRESEQRLAAELATTRTLQEVSTELIQQNNPDALHVRVLDAAVALMRSDFASMQMLDGPADAPASDGALRLLTYHGFSPQAAALWTLVRPTSVCTCGRALVTRQRCIVEDIEACDWMSGSEDQAMYRQLGIRSVQSTPLVSRAGRLIGMISTHWRRPHAPVERELSAFDILARQAADLIERSQAEEIHSRLASIVASSDDAIISKDLNGIITSWNRGAQRLLGYTAEEAIGQPVAMLIPETHLNEEPAILERIRRGQSVEHYETVRRRKDGTLRNVSLTVSPIRDAAGRSIGASKIARDFTERVAMEQRIKQQADALADESRRKDEFLAMLSHELRNPLAPICSALHLLRREEHPGSESDIQQQARDVIERQVGHLTKLVSDLLEVSRLISGRIRLDRHTVDLNQILQHATETAAPLLMQHGHVLVSHLSPTPIWCSVDPTRMEGVFVNLLHNAAKYTPDGGRIEVWCEHPQGQDRALVRVRDNGVGIEADLLPHIFDLFTQAGRSLARSAGGLGIGLSLARCLVELHEGSIEAHSPPPGGGVGSEFIVRLAPAPLRPPQPRPARTTPKSDARAGVRVLVVDDNIDAALMLAAVLRCHGHDVRSAHSGPDGLSAAREWRPDVVLLDIGLPGFDGYEVARRLRRDPALGNAGTRMKLIALTGYGRDTDIAAAHDAGFDAHQVKPIELDDLEKLIRAPRRTSS